MPRTITPLVADVVRPRGSIHHEIWSGVAAPAFEPGVHGIRGEKFLDRLLRFRREMFFRDERDGLVALAAPRASARRRTKTGKQGAGTQEEFPAHLLEPHAERCILRKVARASAAQPAPDRLPRDRKSTRLNSSHGYISYAVFCLKKKKGELMKITHVTTRALRTPSDNPLVVGLPAPTASRSFVILDLRPDQRPAGQGVTFCRGWLAAHTTLVLCVQPCHACRRPH